MSFVLFSCVGLQEEELKEEGTNSGILLVKLTDAPFPTDLVAEANVIINKIELKVEEAEFENDKKEDRDSFIVLFEESVKYNLLELSNGITELLASVELPEGVYKEVRLFVSDASVVLTDGTVFDLKVPSGSSSGLKIKIKPAVYVYPNVENELILDFDVSRSFKVVGNPKNKHGIKGFMFKPVVRAVNNSLSGIIYGVVSNEQEEKIANAAVTLFAGKDTITSARTNTEGYYAIVGVPEGKYFIECEYEEYQKSALTEIEVVAEQKTQQNFTLVK